MLICSHPTEPFPRAFDEVELVVEIIDAPRYRKQQPEKTRPVRFDKAMEENGLFS